MCNGIKKNNEKKLSFYVVFLAENAKLFNGRDIESKFTTLQKSIDAMEKEYNSLSKQIRVGNYLKFLFIEDIARENDISTFAAIEKLNDQITQLIRRRIADPKTTRVIIYVQRLLVTLGQEMHYLEHLEQICPSVRYWHN